MGKKGKKEFEGENLFEKYQISQEAPEFLPLKSTQKNGFIKMDFGLTEWDNSEMLSMVDTLKEVYRDHKIPNFHILYCLKHNVSKELKYLYKEFRRIFYGCE